ncbi:LLM class flavin-dependent oxidoreductase [Nocardia terpenica]|uniref:N5,N10-methylene tetrahydromethanopterin reductase n=1 Tax=Nocardia terpenica TaxID=455432 RepID=A0A291RNY4_9NOCA|nr:LLM class flavin-dependent oxidoreductase [Nocardia terpenica]ATL69035.1 N5,N10-methylene tetrahydromethanopterin reductase [Nocardia terpenica]
MADPAHLRIGVTLPTLGEIATQGIPDVASMARHVEQLGFDAVRIPDLAIGDGTPSLDATVVAAIVAAATTSVRIEFGVRVLPLQPAVTLAAQIMSLQHLSGDRILLGVGSGGFPDSPFWRAVGSAAADRARVTEQTLAVLPGLIAGEATATNGTVVELAPGAHVPPILVGGNTDAAIRRAVRYGDGWLPSSLTPEDLARGVARLRDTAARAGKPTPSVCVAGGAVPGTSEAARRARDDFVRLLQTAYGRSTADAARIPVAGSAAEIAARLAAYADAGADRIGLAVTPSDSSWQTAVERLAEAAALLI